MLRTEHARAVRAAELRRAGCELRRGQAQRGRLGSVNDHSDDGFAILGRREPVGHCLPSGLGGEVPAMPSGALLPDRSHDVCPERVDHVQRHVVGAQQQRLLVRRHAARPRGRIRREHPPGPFPPRSREGGQRLHLLLRSSGERGLGAELHDCRRRRPAPMRLDVTLDKAIGLCVDVPGTSGELLDQCLRHPGDHPGGVPVAASIPRLPRDAEHSGEVVREDRLVQFGERDDSRVHRPPIQAPPFPVKDGLHLVTDDDVRVQMGIARPAVVVVERGGDQTCDVDLCNRAVAAACARARGCNLPLHERNDLRNRRMVRVRDQRLRPGIRNRPQHARGLRDREREVEPRDGPARPTLGLPRFDRRERLRA